jgi:hypothetical protein
MRRPDMARLVVALCVLSVVGSVATPAAAGKCPTGWTNKWTCTKEVRTPRPKNWPKNKIWLGEKCVAHGWKCVPPIK